MSGLLLKMKSGLRRASPTILTCLSVIGTIGTVVTAVRATPKALETVKADSKRNHSGDPYAFTEAEAFRSAWKHYIPSVLIGLSTIACIIGINTTSKRNQASLASAYAMLGESYKQYRSAAKSVYGSDADSRIKAKMAKEIYISADGLSVYSADMDPESEKILCYDMYSKRYFMSTMAAVVNAQYHINRNLQLRGYVTANEFYDFLGLDGIKFGDEIEWSLDNLMEDGFMWLDFENYKTVMDDGMECCVISAAVDPNNFDNHPDRS